MTFEKALRILPSCAMHLAKGQSDLTALRSRVRGYLNTLEAELMVEIGKLHSPSFKTAEILEIDRKMEKLNRFLEQTDAH